MKKNIILLFLSFFTVFAGCSKQEWSIPKNFTPVVLGEDTIGDVISYKIEVIPPKLLRHTGDLNLPVKDDAEVFIKLSINFDKSYSVFNKFEELSFLQAVLTIKEDGKEYKYHLYPYMKKNGFFYGTQLIFPVHKDKYLMELTLEKKPDTVIDNNLKPLFRNVPFFTDSSYKKTFTFYTSLLFF